MKFRPQLMSKSAKLKYKDVLYTYREWVHHNNCMIRIFGQLHYLGSHSYLYKKWHKAERAFLKAHRNF